MRSPNVLTGICEYCHDVVALTLKTHLVRKHKHFQGEYCPGSDKFPVNPVRCTERESKTGLQCLLNWPHDAVPHQAHLTW